MQSLKFSDCFGNWENASLQQKEEEQQQQQQQKVRNQTSPIRNLTYYVKFECGTISGDEGPLRPGHYDTDIGILNKQDCKKSYQSLWLDKQEICNRETRPS